MSTRMYCMNCFFIDNIMCLLSYVNMCACHVYFTINLLNLLYLTSQWQQWSGGLMVRAFDCDWKATMQLTLILQSTGWPKYQADSKGQQPRNKKNVKTIAQNSHEHAVFFDNRSCIRKLVAVESMNEIFIQQETVFVLFCRSVKQCSTNCQLSRKLFCISLELSRANVAYHCSKQQKCGGKSDSNSTIQSQYVY